ncbi:MAG: signal recognition particle-docking protein FtsY, partial [Candidatus Thiodiazotropha sp. 6PLUC5]
MFGFGKRKKSASEAPAEKPAVEEKRGLFSRLQERLTRTRHN